MSLLTVSFGWSASSPKAYLYMGINFVTALIVAGAIFRCTMIGSQCMTKGENISDFLAKIKKVIFASILAAVTLQIFKLIAQAYGVSA